MNNLGSSQQNAARRSDKLVLFMIIVVNVISLLNISEDNRSKNMIWVWPLLIIFSWKQYNYLNSQTDLLSLIDFV